MERGDLPQPPPRLRDFNASVYNVMDFGAIPDGKADNTLAFQGALTAAGNANGGIVLVPAGSFLFKGNLSIPRGVALRGANAAVQSHPDVGRTLQLYGTVLMPTGGRGTEEGAFLTMAENTVVQGLQIYYPDQSAVGTPVAYPWSIAMQGNNPAVEDVECLNCFNAIWAVQAHRHYIARVQGQPIKTGIYIDQTYDIGRLEDVHWNPWFSVDKDFLAYQLKYGRAFVIARTDWEYVVNTFAFAYAIGYHFIESQQGRCNGNFLGIGADMMANASVVVDAADPWGILITNGEFTSFVDPKFGVVLDDPTQVVVNANNHGAVRFVNSAFWGPSNAIARISGSGTTGFSDCTFSAWDHLKQGRAAIEVRGATGNLVVNGNDFQQPGRQIDLGPGTLQRAVVTSNVVAGQVAINGTAHNTQVANNADDSSHPYDGA